MPQAPSVAPSLPDINESLFAEFRRITGSSCRFDFPMWLADAVRHTSRGVSDWHALTKLEQLARLRVHLAKQPPANWPDLRLVIARLANDPAPSWDLPSGDAA